MNFVSLVQRLRRRCRVSGAAGTPVTVVGQNEEYSRLIDFVNEAWVDLQTTREDWQWMRKSCSFTTTAGKAIYTSAEIGLTDFGNWSRDTWRNYLTTTGTNSEIHMTYQDYESWRDVFQFGATRTTQTQPNIVTITPAKAIGLGPVPNGLYTVTGDYYSVPAELVQDTDTPALPAQFHMLIVYKAMMYYGVSEAAPEVYQEGEAEFNRMMIRLQLNQMPDIGAPAPLA